VGCRPSRVLSAAAISTACRACSGNGNRYFALSSWVILYLVVDLAFRAARPGRIAGWLLLAVIAVVGVRGDWRQPASRDFAFALQAARYEALAPGERMQIAHPPGWSFVVTKR
jgi:hypothetical protein